LDEARSQAIARNKETVFASLETLYPDPHVRALAEAGASGDVSEIDRLIASGVDVNSRGGANVTPLFWSMQNVSGFTALLERGADPNVVFEEGGLLSVMHLCATALDPRLLQVALEHGGDPNLVAGSLGETPLFTALGSTERMASLVDGGADVDAKLTSGNPLLLVAARTGRLDAVYLLLTRGADYNVRDMRGNGLTDALASMRPRLNELGLQKLARISTWLGERGVTIPETAPPRR
jgi:ankyrin repeat protein